MKNKQKKKLFCWCDFLVPTGFGNVAKNLLDTMHEEYDVSILGINYHGDERYDTDKYFVYPISRDDMLGTRKIKKLIQREKPDLIFLFQDIFHISEIIKKIKQEWAPEAKVVSYFPIDGAPVSFAWGDLFTYSDAIVEYSDWAIEVTKQMKNFSMPDKKLWKLYHGVNQRTFYPHSKGKIDELRQSFGWDNKFVVTNINRFQPRKFIPGTARAFSMFAKGWKENEDGFRMPIDREWCDLTRSKNLTTHGTPKDDVFLYLHCMPKEFSMGPGNANLLQNHLLNAGFEDSDVNRILGVNARNIYAGEVSESELNDIYNASNINISSTLGEGCGLSLIESAATGTPSIAPFNSAVPEMLGDTGHLIPNNTVINQALDNGHLRPVVDMAAMADALEIEYQKWKKEGKGSKIIDISCIERVNDKFQWEDKRELLKDIFAKTLEGTVND
tara:strand:- start:8522 stop:9850 length:1329 start_codon:yes stop_codon:yes gene_type:complete